MLPEKLSERDRNLLANSGPGYRALSLIDALTLRLAATEQKLADANALIQDVLDEYGIDWSRSNTRERLEAHLAGQPAAPSRTDAEQAVLDAMAAARVASLRQLAALPEGVAYASVGAAAKAELARRRLK